MFDDFEERMAGKAHMAPYLMFEHNERERERRGYY
jgi:hypothetical protein